MYFTIVKNPTSAVSSLELSVIAHDLFTFSRFKNEVPIDPSFRHDMKLDPEGFQTLTISDVKAADKGIYKVKVSNTAGWASCDAKLYIRS